MSKQFVIRSEDTRPIKRAKPTSVKQEPSDGVMIIPPMSTELALPHSKSANVRVIATLDMKATRMQVLGA